jgi:esterase/lipase superfamily enzyme
MITNRKVKHKKSKGHGLFSDGIDNELHIADLERLSTPQIRRVGPPHRRLIRKIEKMKKSYRLEYKNAAEHENYLQGIANNVDNDRPWVLFLHGNNQTTKKNLAKSRIIQDLYNVNLVIFSWPSRSYDDKLIKYLGASMVSLFIPGGKDLAKILTKKGIKRKIKQYNEARDFATKTASQFKAALNLLEVNLFNTVKANGSKISLLTHSLGHKVLRDGIQLYNMNQAGFGFDSIVLHQADEDIPNHGDWMQSLPLSNNDLSNIAITRNYNDLVLFLSSLVNSNINLDQKNSRIGNRAAMDSDDPRFTYLDFTGMNNVRFDHNVAWDNKLDIEIKNIFSNLLT